MTTTKKIKGLVHFVFAIYLVSVLLDVQVPVHGRVLLQKKPDPENAAASARWLVSQNIWGVLDTISSDLGGAPFGNVVSFSDGEPGKGSGIPYFYLTTLDPTARKALKDPRVSLTISEHPIGTCGKTDPENPTCAKLTLNGKLRLADPKELEFAKRALFTKHPEMKDWPKTHNFQFFKLDIENIFLINWFGGPKPLTFDHTENALTPGLLVIKL
ncbi:protein CREG1 [Pyrus ussuriensis x Pyrus communis]|uniref:Protein CREG1 n=1 Tax=Pyrus ussuriensis x Pyrus communis TaxID=2448454 RepID=A0A5N5F7G2_9ROSA|nr:protein CREG1 [Pyrus ussuriensis x Pyrus communis]